MKKFSNGRLVGAVLVPLAIGGTLAGCGDDNDTAKSGGSSTSSAPAQSSPKPTAAATDVDKAFVRQMVPHHQMAVDMAETAKKSAEHEEVKQLAGDIIADQNKEITELEAIAKDLGVTPAERMEDGAAMDHGDMTADAKTLGLPLKQLGMSMDMASLVKADPFDKAFIEQMTVHHQGAIAMARAQLAGGEDADLKKIATAIVSAQEAETTQMADWKAKWYGSADDSAASADQSGGVSEEHSGH